VTDGDTGPVTELEAALSKVVELQAALQSSREIGMAMGIVMERHGLTPDRAYLVLQRISQRRNLKLRDVAEHIVQTGEEPG
jgi:AmiR/NasT family two-component response regulator